MKLLTFSLLNVLLDISVKNDAKGTFNNILNDYGVPAIAFVIIVAGVYGVVTNLDKIMDADGRGTRKEGILNVLYIMGGVAIAVMVIGVIVRLVTGISMSI